MTFLPIPFQVPIPWAVRALVQRPLSPTEELMEVLSRDAEPLVARWASGLRGRIRQTEDLSQELFALESEGGPVARSLAEAVREAWHAFGGTHLPPRPSPQHQSRLPL